MVKPIPTNYDVYFSDLGTIDDIVSAFVQMRCETCTPNCPFFNWPGFEYSDNDCTEFVVWLSKPVIAQDSQK